MNERFTRRGTAPSGTGRGVSALVVAVLALLAVVTTLFAVGQMTRALREEVIRTVEPARNRLYEIQRLLALQEAEQRGGAPPGVLRPSLPDPPAVRRELDVALARLRPHGTELGLESLESFAELQAHIRAWQTHLEQAGRSPTSPDLRGVVESDYARVLAASDRLHEVLRTEAAARRDRIANLERLEVALIIGMVLLASVAILVLWRVVQQQAALVEDARRLTSEAEARRAELEHVSEQKAQFIRGITHDLKNPLGAVDAYAELLEVEIKGPLVPDQRHYVARIRRSVQQVLATIHDLLELARAEAEGIRIERRLTDVSELIHDVVEDYRATIEGAGLSLDLALEDDLPGLATDERRVREVLGNLLSNAVKFTPYGGRVCIRAEVRPEGMEGGASALVIEVEDTGPGIPQEAGERIFEEFQRLERSEAAGAGVGLAISRQMARLLGGDLTVRSRVGEGSVFSLQLPLTGSMPHNISV